MKALVIESSEGTVQLLMMGKDLPIVGKYYNLEDASEGSNAQNKTFHALTLEYFKSGQSSYDVSSYAEFKIEIKIQLGEGYEKFFYGAIVDGKPKIIEVKTKEEIPKGIALDLIRAKLKSWSDYTKKQRKETIDNVITEMLAAGVNTTKFEEILEGMSHEHIHD